MDSDGARYSSSEDAAFIATDPADMTATILWLPLLIAIALSFITNFPDYFIVRRFGKIRISEVVMKLCTSMIAGLLLATLLGCATHSRPDSVTEKNETRGLPGAMHGAHETNTPTSQPPGSGLTKAN